jgi:proteasome lid subunit RPN8/RPN11
MIQIPQHLINAILEHTTRDHPNEACGYLEGPNYHTPTTHRPMANAHPNPTRGYQFDPTEQNTHWEEMHRTGNRPAVFYHSHSTGILHPSTADITNMLNYPDSHHIIAIPLNQGTATYAIYKIQNGLHVATTATITQN